jgi:hypothetical protein
MGFDLQTLRFLMEAKAQGVDFTDTLTLGRQNLHIDRAGYHREALRFGLKPCEQAFLSMPYAESLLQSLGANEPRSLDVSRYESATDIADMNDPLPDILAGQFSALIDGGTLEHVFNFRQAAINVGKLLRVGGHFISVTCANNFLGHGFYQFSPELFFRVFCPANGFEVESLILCEVNADGDWYEVSDPAAVRSRVELRNNARNHIMPAPARLLRSLCSARRRNKATTTIRNGRLMPYRSPTRNLARPLGCSGWLRPVFRSLFVGRSAV